jgi:hypothetical protein
MKAMVILFLSCLCLRGADDLKAAKVVSKDAPTGTVKTQEFFTRSGLTNLVCTTTRRNGVVRSRLYSFYHNGKHAADQLTVPALGSALLSTYNGCDLAMASRSNCLSEVTLMDPYGRLLDMFLSTKGDLAPIPTAQLREYITNPAAFELFKEKQRAR